CARELLQVQGPGRLPGTDAIREVLIAGSDRARRAGSAGQRERRHLGVDVAGALDVDRGIGVHARSPAVRALAVREVALLGAAVLARSRTVCIGAGVSDAGRRVAALVERAVHAVAPLLEPGARVAAVARAGRGARAGGSEAVRRIQVVVGRLEVLAD